MNTKGLTIYRSSAGSGKTFTLVLNYLKLIIQDENPFKFQEILAITFTNKAAKEMKFRIGNIIGNAVEGMNWLGIFHGFGTNLLRMRAG